MANGGFDGGYRLWRSSSAHAALFGEGLPQEVEPFSFVPADGLREVGALFGLRRGQTLVDLGCGRGGPGLWLAAQGKARLLGVDTSSVAVADARQRRTLFPAIAGANFQLADVAATGLPDRCADAVVSIDVVQLLDEPARLLRESARPLGPDRPVVITTWEGRQSAPERFPRSVAGLFEDAGLYVDLVEERPAWLRRQLNIDQQAASIGFPDPAVCDLARDGCRWRAIPHNVRRVVVRGDLPG